MRTCTGRTLLNPDALLDRIGVGRGHVVADIGCGALGHFLFPASRRVGADGRVYGVDIQRRALDMVSRSAEAERFFNIQPVWGDAERLRGTTLDDHHADVSLLINTLSSSSRPIDMVREVERVTRPHGIVLVVDWDHSGTVLGPSTQHRVAEETAKEWFNRHAFELEDAFSAGQDHYGLVFRRT